MASLPERLRSSCPKMVGSASAQCNDIEAVHLAADEIERLRSCLDTVRFHLRRDDHVIQPTAKTCTDQLIGAIDAALAAQ